MRAPQVANVTVTIIGDITFTGPLAADPLGFVQRMDPAMRDLLRGDILLANLECILSDTVAPNVRGSGDFPMHGPTRAVEALRWLGVDAVSLANNHVIDFGPAGAESTGAALKAAGIAHFGVGTLAEAGEPCVIERGGLRIGLLGFGGSLVPKRRRVGSIPLDWPQARRAIARTKERCDRVIVYFHEGIEALNYPMKRTVAGCHGAVEAGADLVVGAHPHTIQGIERYRGVPIAYSLGNFIMPTLDSSGYADWLSKTTLTRLGIEFPKSLIAKQLVLRCTLSREGVEVQGTPILAEESGLPRLPTPAEAPAEEAFFRQLCGAFLHPEDPAWQQRDEIERGHYRVLRGNITPGFLLSRLHRLRWRHIAWYLKTLWQDR